MQGSSFHQSPTPPPSSPNKSERRLLNVLPMLESCQGWRVRREMKSCEVWGIFFFFSETRVPDNLGMEKNGAISWKVSPVLIKSSRPIYMPPPPNNVNNRTTDLSLYGCLNLPYCKQTAIACIFHGSQFFISKKLN